MPNPQKESSGVTGPVRSYDGKRLSFHFIFPVFQNSNYYYVIEKTNIKTVNACPTHSILILFLYPKA